MKIIFFYYLNIQLLFLIYIRIIKCQFENAKPIITSVQQTGAENIYLEWTVDYNAESFNLARYIISYSSDNWQTSQEWPAQMSRITYGASSSNPPKVKTLSKFECTNECINTPDCNYIISTKLEVRELCIIYVGTIKPSDNCVEPNDCLVLKEYESQAYLNGIPFNEIYQFKVKVYDEITSKWSSNSDPSQDINMKIDFDASFDFIKELNETYSLKVSWSQKSKYEYPVSRYNSIHIFGGNGYVQNYESTSERLLNKYTYVNSSNFYETIEDPTYTENLTECFHKCVDTTDCKYFAYEIKTSKCYLQIGNITASLNCDSRLVCGYLKNELNEITNANIRNDTLYSIQIEYETYYGSMGNVTIQQRIAKIDEKQRTLYILSIVLPIIFGAIFLVLLLIVIYLIARRISMNKQDRLLSNKSVNFDNAFMTTQTQYEYEDTSVNMSRF